MSPILNSSVFHQVIYRKRSRLSNKTSVLDLTTFMPIPEWSVTRLSDDKGHLVFEQLTNRTAFQNELSLRTKVPPCRDRGQDQQVGEDWKGVKARKGGLKDRGERGSSHHTLVHQNPRQAEGSGAGVKNTDAPPPMHAPPKATLLSFPNIELYMNEITCFLWLFLLDGI